MEDDDTVGSFEICIVDEFRVNGIWKKIAQIRPIEGRGRRCLRQTMSL